MMFYYKTYKYEKDLLVAICDEELLGKSFPFGDVTFVVKKDFYGGESCDQKDVLRIIENATIINAVGKNIVKLLISNGFIDEDKVLEIGEVLHAQMVKI
ncbi:MAG: DUF424 family protein [Candidatus Aenigmarchaeota archaeon]|nr:DUF424 family protein [Candidatus Aenigmarchaeota archaeon]